MGYTKDAVKGISWLGTFRFVNRGVSFLKIAILARILSPAQYGVFGVASLMLALLEVFTETGINIVLIQEKEDIDKFIDTAWVVSILRGIIIASILFISSELIANFFHAPNAQNLLAWISIVPFIRGFINPSVAKFLKELKYRKQFLYTTAVFLVETIISVTLVIFLKQPIGIVYGMICSAIFEVILTFVIANPTPNLTYQNAYISRIFHRGKWLTLSGIFNYLYHNFDNIIVGHMLGTYYLGIYDRAYNISMLPITEVGDVINQATFPVYVKITNDAKRLKTAFLKSTVLIALITIPIGLIFLFFPKLVILIILGPNWLAGYQVLQVLALFGVIRAVTYSSTTLLIALKKQRTASIITMVSLIGMAVTIVPLINAWHVVGAGYAAITGALIAIPFTVFFVNKELRSIQKD